MSNKLNYLDFMDYKIIEKPSDATKIQGIYGIVNTACTSPYFPLGKIYVGQAGIDRTGRGIGRRLSSHITELNQEKFRNKCNLHLFRAWKKYGEDKFIFVLLEEVLDSSNLTAKENSWVQNLKSNNEKYGYNKRETCDSNLGTIFKKINPKKLKKYIKKFYELHNYWPKSKSGTLDCIPGEGWRAIDAALNLGTRGLPKLGSLANFIYKEFGIHHQRSHPDLSVAVVKKWIELYQQKYNKLPNQRSGIVEWSEQDGCEPNLSWACVYQCFANNTRGINLSLTVPEFIAKEFNVINRTNCPNYTEEIVKKWCIQFKEKHGKYPFSGSGIIEWAKSDGFVSVTWAAIDKALANGHNGLLGGSNLYSFVIKHVKNGIWEESNGRKYKGVYQSTNSKNFAAAIRVKNKNISLGSYISEIEAARAYDIAAKKYFGEIAEINGIEESIVPDKIKRGQFSNGRPRKNIGTSVYFDKQSQKYMATIVVLGKRKRKSFKTKIEASEFIENFTK